MLDPKFLISPYSRIYSLFHEKVGSVFIKIEAWTLFSISLPRRGEGDSGMIRKEREPPTSWRPCSHADLLPDLVRLTFIHPPSNTSAQGPQGSFDQGIQPALDRRCDQEETDNKHGEI